MLKNNNRRLLEFLREELKAVESGGYAHIQEQPWRARLVFEDSPGCLNFGKREHCVPCEECVLMRFVPKDRCNEKAPCRFIPLDANGQTIDSMYRCGTQQELETGLAQWLRRAIARIEQEVAQKRSTAA